MNFKNLFTKKTADYTFTILFFLIFSMFIIFAIKPSLTTAASLKKEEFDLKRIDRLYENKIINIANVQALIEQNRDEIPLLSQAVSESPQVNKLIEDIKTISEKNSFTLQNASIGEVNLFDPNSKSLSKLRISIEGKSSFDDLMRFIQALFNQRRLKTVQKMIVTRDIDSSPSGRLKIIMEIEAYYL